MATVGFNGFMQNLEVHMERLKFAATSGDALLDLTVLLLTGKGPPSMREFFSTSGRLSERVRILCSSSIASLMLI